MPSKPLIRPMTGPDIEPLSAAILRDKWGDRRTWFEFATSQAQCHPVLAEADGRLIGCGVGTANGPVGWVGTIWVEPEHRGAGLGRALTQAVIDALEAAGCRTLVLVATDEGLPLYERMGFAIQTRYRIFEARGIDADAPTVVEAGVAADDVETLIRAYRPSDLEPIARLDAEATGEDRAHAIRRFASAESTRVLVRDGDVAAFVMRAPWGGGATIARDPGAALRILDARRRATGSAGRVRLGLFEGNAAGLAALRAAGLRPVWSAPRLVRGEPIAWRPDWIWGQFNHAMG